MSDPRPTASESTNALLGAFPSLARTLPFRPLGRFPTPLEHAPQLLPRVDLWLKRDDLAATRYGGNKVRKLEFLLGAAERARAERLVTVGGWGSHHVLATALYGRDMGLRVDAVVFPQPVTEAVKRTLLVGAAAGATFHAMPNAAAVPLGVLSALAHPGVYWIAPGGSSPTGTLGWVAAGLELGRQMREVAVGTSDRFDAIYVALGSSGTVAGLHLGLGMAEWTGRLVAVRVVERLVSNARRTRRLAERTADVMAEASEGDVDLERAIAGPRPPVVVDHRFIGPGYGHTTPAAEEAIAVARAAGLTLEPTYTGKAFAALLADARAGLLDGKRVLFVDTFAATDLAPLTPTGPAREAAVAALPHALRAVVAD